MKRFFSKKLSKALVSIMITSQLLTNAPISVAADINDSTKWGMYKYQSTNKVSEANSDLERRFKNITDYYVETINNQELTAVAEEGEKLPNGTLLKDYLSAKYKLKEERTNGSGKKEYVYNTGILGDPIVNGSTYSYRRIAAGLFNKRMGGSEYYFTQNAPSDFSAQVDKWTEGITKYAEPGTEAVADDTGKLTVEKRYGDYDMDMKEMISLIYMMKSSLGDGNNYTMSDTAIKNIINKGLRPALRPWQNCMHIALKIDLDSDFNSNLPDYALSSETENHVLMTLSSIYLTNQWIEKNYRGLNIQPVAGCSNTPEFKDMLLQVLARIVHSDFFETNGRNYQVFTLHSLFNLYAFSEDETIRAGAKNALDFTTAKFAFQSFEGKRMAPHRRNIEYDNRLDFYENDSTVFVMNTLSGASVWNDNLTGNWAIDKDNYFMGKSAQGLGHSFWAAMMSTGIFVKNYYMLQPAIHDFMLDKHNGYWARMQSRYTGKNYRMEFSNDPNSKDADPLYFDGNGKINLWEGAQNSPRYWIEHDLSFNKDVAHLQLLRDSNVTFESAPELYFVTPDYINISGGKKEAYPNGNEIIATQVTDWGKKLGFLEENWAKLLLGIGSYKPGPQDDLKSLGKKTGTYDFKAFPSTVLGRGFTGNWWGKTVVPAGATESKDQLSTKAFISDNLALSSEWDPSKWSESNNLGTYKSVSYGLNINVPSSWIPLNENGVSDFYSSNDTQTQIKYNFYEFPASPNNYIVVATIKGTNKGLWEIVPKKRFNNNFTNFKNSVLNNNVYFLSTANVYTYKMTNGEILTLSTTAGANGENPIVGIKSSDGTSLEMKNAHVGGNAKEMPLIDVCEVDENYNLTGVKYAYSNGDGRVFICNPYAPYGSQTFWIDSSDYKNPKTLPPFLTIGNGTIYIADHQNLMLESYGPVNIGGWLLDEKPVSKLDVLLDGKYYTTATYGSSRPDLLTWYPQYNNPNCGFNFTLDKSNLPYGEHTLALLVTSSDGTQKYCPLMPKMFGVPTIGYIDTPSIGSKVNGIVPVAGWVQSGNGITLTDGVSKIDVLVDGKYKGTATYGLKRKDVLTVFPEYKLENSGFYYDLDTSSLSIGQHNISLSVTTKTGRVVSIGNTTVNVSDVIPPSIGSVSASTRLIKNGTFNVKINNVNDIGSKVSKVTVTVKKTGESLTQTFDAANIGNNNYEAIVDTNIFGETSPEGEYKYIVKAIDENSNVTTWKWANGLTTQTVYVNKNAPQNWALNKTASASVMDWSNETPSKAVNGTFKNDISDKWCTGYGKGTNSWLQIDLGESKPIDRWKVIHESGSGNGYTQFTTKDFSLKYSNDGSTWLTADTVSSNVLGITDRRIPEITARYIKLEIASGDSDGCARIYEFQAYKEATYTDNDVTVKIPTPKVSNINVKMFNGTTSNITSSINPKIKITNQGTIAVNLADLKLHYYYTSDGEQDQKFVCDWATVGNSNVTSKFTKLATSKTGSNYYLEIGFTNTAGTLQPNASTEVQVRFNKSDWTNYTQTGDYSFNSTATSYVDWTNITAYLSDTLQWGIEP